MDEYLTPAQASDFTGLTVEHLAQLRWRHIGPTYLRMTPRTIRYRRADLEAWLARSAVEPAAS